ncbi:MAG: hypothetical protein ACYDEX_24295 [Mobilitalea sp.]
MYGNTREQFKEILIPLNLYSELEDRIKQTEFTSVQAYILFILNEILSDDNETTFSQEEEEEIKNKLRDLGYMG